MKIIENFAFIIILINKISCLQLEMHQLNNEGLNRENILSANTNIINTHSNIFNSNNRLIKGKYLIKKFTRLKYCRQSAI